METVKYPERVQERMTSKEEECVRIVEELNAYLLENCATTDHDRLTPEMKERIFAIMQSKGTFPMMFCGGDFYGSILEMGKHQEFLYTKYDGTTLSMTFTEKDRDAVAWLKHRGVDLADYANILDEGTYIMRRSVFINKTERSAHVRAILDNAEAD